MDVDAFMPLLAVTLCTFFLGIGTSWFYQHWRLRSYQYLGAEILRRAEIDVQALRQRTELTARQEQLDKQRDLEALWHLERKKLQKEEDRLKEREDRLDQRLGLLDKKLADVEKREVALTKQQQVLDAKQQQLSALEKKRQGEIEGLAQMSLAEAKAALMQHVENELRGEIAKLTHRLQQEAEENANRDAAKVLATAINRLTVSCVSEATTTTVSIPGDEMKSRIIGREGRNIRHLERLTGVNFLIDDTPGAIVLSSFDPIRKQIAKMALSELIQDGRIHPTRIEETVVKARVELDQLIKQYGKDAAIRAGALDLHADLITLLGKLKFRTSYGQNVLDHSLEVAGLMGSIASEMGLDISLAKRIGLLHDIGKAISHEVEGSHAVIGHDLALRCGESQEVANGIGCHHQEMPPLTVEANLCAAADALSGARPGARIEAVDQYLKRLKSLEDIAYQFSGVERAYAMQAGREIHVTVLPDAVDETALTLMARNIARKIEKELSYAGKIKVTLIREKRATQYAL